MTVHSLTRGLWSCPHCGFERNESEQVSCELCSHPREETERAATEPASAPLPAPPPDRLERAFAQRARTVREERKKLMLAMVIGSLCGIFLDHFPLLSYAGWFVSALVHELGHCIAAWLAGMPAAPAIRLDGHAAAIHGPQSKLFVLIVTGLIATAAWQARTRGPGFVALLTGAAVLQLGYAFSSLNEIVHLYAGHLGELAFAGVFLWRGFSGGFTSSPLEQGGYALFGGHLIWHNLWLNGGLLFSEARRAWYQASGSFGLKNDYLVLSEEVLQCRLATVVWPMMILTAAVPILAFLLARWHLRRRSVETA